MKDYILNLDKPRKLRFGYGALRLIRLKLGEKSIENMMNIPTDEMPVFAWAGLKWDDNDLTIEQTEEMLDAAIPEKYTIMGATIIIMNAIAAHVGIDTKKALADALKLQEKKLKEEKEKAEAEKKAEKAEPTGTIPSSKKHKK